MATNPTNYNVRMAALEATDIARYLAMAVGHEGFCGRDDDTCTSHWIAVANKALEDTSRRLGFKLIPLEEPATEATEQAA